MSRGHVELAHAEQQSWRELSLPGWPAGARVNVLSEDPGSGAFSGLLELPAGWRRPEGWLGGACEWLLLQGALRLGEQMRAFGFYEFSPAGVRQSAWSTESGATLLFFARERAPAFCPSGSADAAGATDQARTGAMDQERIELDTEAMAWSPSPVPGPPEGLLLKLLRHDERSGEMTFLCATAPHYDYPMLEFHDCVEEVYMIEGDIWLANSGLMRAGSYFWRPPFVTHGPFYSREGALMLGWVPSTLVNHVPASAASRPEENLARFIAAGGERVLASGDQAAAAAGER
jgi:hypothetical protein